MRDVNKAIIVSGLMLAGLLFATNARSMSAQEYLCPIGYTWDRSQVLVVLGDCMPPNKKLSGQCDAVLDKLNADTRRLFDLDDLTVTGLIYECVTSSVNWGLR